MQAIGLTKKASNQRMWLRLEHMALRYASAGCAIKVHCLHNRRPGDGPLFELMKTEDSLFQAPGCTRPFENGVRVPSFVRGGIAEAELDGSWLVGWAAA